ncbi:MAG: hypothetical protein A3F84_10400 [Candidatus Handelsmanbacteria bacterium RIFCSPLOWO2_12_FULL_64_10]|uniref:AB hydrolase-1 domain-containing protein n=1 Tax=Handelsmanbacteria sp. (strain RIFCSPLOWO2_12_FULL_64_10) TaxID=1817868 RepID=A0A1F6CAG9_HANXR|nr:MAG: hypothetical protein A3F84_10400 [Candidatus Handelsmanbacteria bacterium RIFCSPLOWO2_12_FULL_64_10]
MPPTVLIAGTWGDYQEESWWRPGSPFVREAVRHGVHLLDPGDPFRWSTRLDGLMGGNAEWELSGEVLKWYCHAKAPGETVNLIAHSHGGQVAAYALARGLKVGTLVTVATPVRRDMEDVYQRACLRNGLPRCVHRWVHIHTDRRDLWQWFGELGDGLLGIRRGMPAPAENVSEPGRDHGSLLDPALWTSRGWWEWVREEV